LPVGLVADATDIPRKVRILGKTSFRRDRHGRTGPAARAAATEPGSTARHSIPGIADRLA